MVGGDSAPPLRVPLRVFREREFQVSDVTIAGNIDLNVNVNAVKAGQTALHKEQPRVVTGKRRFTCITPTLVRLEFSPDGVFEDRRSLVAHAKRTAELFESVSTDGETTLLRTPALTLLSREPEKAFFPANLEVRWHQNGLLQYWHPGDKDYQNLGGTVRSLDRFGNLTKIEGVHPADMESPDSKATTWLAWLQCEDDTYYYKNSPDCDRPGLNGDFHAAAKYRLPNILERTRNHIFDHLHYGPGVLSRSGYFFLNDSASPVMDEDDFPVERCRPGYQDWYFFAYGGDYKTGLADFIKLTGRAPLPTKQSFGLMFSRWPAYDEAEAKQIVGEFEEQGVPLSVLILDMEWHKEGWGHWEWNEKFYPYPAAFFKWCRQRGLAVSLNDHPLDVRRDDCHFQPYLDKAGTEARVRNAEYQKKPVDMIDINICNKTEANAFLEVCHKHIVEQGMSFWWNDGCKGVLNGAINQLVANKVFFEEVKSGENRGMLLARYGGLGSHRYGAFFTGDTLSCWEILATQCEFNVRAGQVGVAYVSHDIGGFFTGGKVKLLDSNLYLRWLQFGVFNPVFRFHSAPGSGSRKPWDYGDRCNAIAKRWLRVRNSLIPYLYTAARRHHDTGIPIVRGLYIDHPQDEQAYVYDQFAFASDIVVAPILSASNYRHVYLPEGAYYRFETNERVKGGKRFIEHMGPGGIPAYVKAGSVLVRQCPDAPPAAAHVEKLWLDIYPGADGDAELYEDDGISPRYEQGACCRTIFTLRTAAGTVELSGRVTEGEPFGDAREITLTISLDNAPASIVMEDGRTAAWEESKTAGRYKAILPALPANQPFSVVINLQSE